MKLKFIYFFSFLLFCYNSFGQTFNWNTVSYTTGSLSPNFGAIGSPPSIVTKAVTGYTAGLGSGFPVKYQANPDAGTGTPCTVNCALRSAPNFSSPGVQTLITTFTFSPAVVGLVFPVYDIDGAGAVSDSLRINAIGPTGANIINMVNVSPGSSTITGSGTTSPIAKGINGMGTDFQTNVTVIGPTSTLVFTFMGQGTYSIGNLSWASLLPVKFISFSGQTLANGTVGLKWTTENELNIDHYSIERSKNGEVYNELSTLTPNGNTTNNYNFIDVNPGTGNSFYRIRETDKDGKYKFSNIILIKNKTGLSNEVILFPNPASDYIQFSAADAQFININILNPSGQLVYQSSTKDQSNKINISSLQPGLYLLKIQQYSGSFIYGKFIKN